MTASSSRPASRRRFLLLVIDGKEQAAELAEELGAHDVQAVVCTDPAEALLQAGILRPDAVLTAPDLAPLDTDTVVRVLAERSGIPVLLGVDEPDGPATTAALATGVVASVTRPYRSGEVLPILQSIASKPAPKPGRRLKVGTLRLDPDAQEVRLRGQPIRLPPREFRLLQLLMANAGRVVRREEILTEVWPGSGAETSNTLTVHIQRLRARLGDDPHNPTVIVTVRGMGYRLSSPS